MEWRGTSMGVLLGAAACASAQTPAPASVSEPTQTPAPASASAPTPAQAPAPAPTPTPLPTGGVVLIGEINSPPSFAPRPVLESAKPELLACYNQARQANPPLHGKLMLRINVNEMGAVLLVDAAPGGTASDPALVACLGDALRALRFPKPGGDAVVSVPLVFHR